MIGMPLDHERLLVYQRSLAFIRWSSVLNREVGPCGDVRSQLDRASTSVPLNLAEGNGKFSIRDRLKYLDIAYGSALECAACLDVMVAKEAVTDARMADGKRLLEELVHMLVRLRAAIAARESTEPACDRIRENHPAPFAFINSIDEIPHV